MLEEVCLDDLVDAHHLGLDEPVLGHVADELHHQVTVGRKKRMKGEYIFSPSNASSQVPGEWLHITVTYFCCHLHYHPLLPRSFWIQNH